MAEPESVLLPRIVNNDSNLIQKKCFDKKTMMEKIKKRSETVYLFSTRIKFYRQKAMVEERTKTRDYGGE